MERNRRKRRNNRWLKRTLRMVASFLFAFMVVSMISPTFGGIAKEDSNSPEATTAPTLTTEEPTVHTTSPDTVEETEAIIDVPVTEAQTEPQETECAATVEQPPATEPTKAFDNDIVADSRSGYIGRLKIPSVGISVALRESWDGETSQAYVDERDSAALYRNGAATIVADHNNQEFKTLHKVSIGDSATVYHLDGSRTDYVVTDKFTGHNTLTELTDDDWRCIYDDNIGGLTLYTCRNGWQNIWIVFLQPTT